MKNEKNTAMNAMKKVLAVTLTAGIGFLCAGCGNAQAATTAAESTAAATTAAESTAAATTAVESTTAATTATQETGASEAASVETTGAKTLVVYFSNTGHTKTIAEQLASGLSADLYEIKPEIPYTAADLNYGDKTSRSTKEMNDASARPAISGSVENIEQYEIVYIGYPIWWGQAPRIMDTFVEAYDFTNKTVVPFCTSGSSGIGSSGKTLQELAKTGNWLEGKRFSGSESQDEVMAWAKGL